jgi:uncharacterized protein YbaR (Trm112 family)
MKISELLLEKLACPCASHGKLLVDGGELRSTCCNQKFAVKNGIPVLLPTGGDNA